MTTQSEPWRKTLEQWQAEGNELFGPKMRDWKFECPHCHDVTSGRDFLALGLTPQEASDRLGQECIGRQLGAIDKSIPKGKYKGRGCDWVAYGLFRGPIIVMIEDKEVGVFDFFRPHSDHPEEKGFHRLYSKGGETAHLVSDSADPVRTLCGREAGAMLGMGNQHELDEAQRRRLCRQCKVHL